MIRLTVKAFLPVKPERGLLNSSLSLSMSDTYRFKNVDPASEILMGVDGGGTLLLIVLPLVSLEKIEVLVLCGCIATLDIEDGFEAWVGTVNTHPRIHSEYENFLGLAVSISELFIVTLKKKGQFQSKGDS